MRMKSFYSANEITNNLYTTGQEYMTSDKQEYIGLYHKYTTNEIYTQPTWNKNKSLKLFKYKKRNIQNETYDRVTTVKLNYNSFNNVNIVIEKKDIDLGVIDRFILKKINEPKFYEVDKETYKQHQSKKIDPALYSAIKIKWTISGPLQTNRKGPIVILSVRDKNIAEVDRAEKKMPGISTYLNNPLQYYTDDDFISPADINGLDS
tara:strand:+ start:6717 stop:7334 length:618 start_codon:yes stop_codon:yes gene_type:complete